MTELATVTTDAQTEIRDRIDRLEFAVRDLDIATAKAAHNGIDRVVITDALEDALLSAELAVGELLRLAKAAAER